MWATADDKANYDEIGSLGWGRGARHCYAPPPLPPRLEPSRLFLLRLEIPMRWFLQSSAISLINSLFWCSFNHTDTIEENGFAISRKGDVIE